MKFSVTYKGKQVDPSWYSWDEKTRTFFTRSSDLIIDFSGTNYATFKTGSNCTIIAGFYCIFKTEFGCTLITGPDCVFITGSNCTFITGADCTFKTGSNCTFKTGLYCLFNTGSNCTFKTGIVLKSKMDEYLYNTTIDTNMFPFNIIRTQCKVLKKVYNEGDDEPVYVVSDEAGKIFEIRKSNYCETQKEADSRLFHRLHENMHDIDEEITKLQHTFQQLEIITSELKPSKIGEKL